MNGQPDYVLRRMDLADIPQVVRIDREAFPIPWSASVYRYEISQNPLSTMVVASLFDAEAEPISLPARLLARLRGAPAPAWHPAVVGYGGFWLSRGEAHISTIATHPDFRGLGLGELLLAGMIRRALAQDARELSLEVRISNAPAIALYEKYRFRKAGIKARYYRDNHEDAHDMRVPVDTALRAHFARLWAALNDRLRFQDQFTVVVARPRLKF
ncbi:MAG: ribosomal protein S18-alanine N-acetyltransferase [Anaerolineae bacterium]|nr:ribosomal protein S18-alanine N-acetyltransferase [Anaerolineae bacterium]